MRATKREAIVLGLGTVTGVGATTLLSDSAEGATLDGEITIPDKSKEVTNPVSGLRLSVQGSYSWDGQVVPDRAVLRLSVERGATDQLKAKKLTDLQDTAHTADYSFQDINLLEHSNISIDDASPTEIGETKTITITVIVTLTVSKGGETLDTAEISDTSTVEVTKGMGTVEATLQASGEVQVLTD